MSADIGQRFTGWTYSGAQRNDDIPQDPSIQQMVLDHGSVSFGRFDAEPLSWEKRSVFAHNSRQEELSKLTAPGLVAQKKAFFEEHYKRARHLKAQGAMQQTQSTTTSEEANDENTLGCSRQAEEDQLPVVASDNPVASAPSSSFEPSTEVSSADERKCQEAHNIGYLTFNPLFSQTAGPQNIQQEKRSSSGEIDSELRYATNTNCNHGHNGESVQRKVLQPRRVVSNDNGENNVAKTRIVLPKASLLSEGLKVACGKQGARKSAPLINRPMKRSKELSTSVIQNPRADLRRNPENRPSQDLKDPFLKRVEMKLRALSDRMSAEKAAATSRPASYQPPDRAMTMRKSSYRNADKLGDSSRPSLCQNTGRVLAPSKSAAQASHRSHTGVHADALPRVTSFKKGSSASNNSTATGKSAAKILVMPSSSQVTSKGTAGLTRVNNASQNKRKQWSKPAPSYENNPRYVRKSMPRSARSSSDNSLPAAKVPRIANRMNETKSEFVQKSRPSSHHVAGRSNTTKPTVNCNEQNTKVTSTRAGSLARSSMRSNLMGGPSRAKNNPRQERPRWR